MSELPFPFGYYRAEGGDYSRVVVRSQTDQPLDQVSGLSLWSNEGFHALFYMKVAAPSPAFSLNPIIPNSWTSCPFQYLFWFREDGYNEQKHKVPLPSVAHWGREKARAEASDRVWVNSVHAKPRPPWTNSLRLQPWDGLSVALSSRTHTKDEKPPGSLQASFMPIFPLPGVWHETCCRDSVREHFRFLVRHPKGCDSPPQTEEEKVGVELAQGWGLLALPPFQSR